MLGVEHLGPISSISMSIKIFFIIKNKIITWTLKLKSTLITYIKKTDYY